MKEKLAVILAKRMVDIPWCSMPKKKRAAYLNDVDALLDAMREPSGAMLDAGEKILPAYETQPTIASVQAAVVWQAMIDAIKAGK